MGQVHESCEVGRVRERRRAHLDAHWNDVPLGGPGTGADRNDSPLVDLQRSRRAAEKRDT